MKKILLGTSALVLAGAVAAPASAAEWEVNVGGFFTGGIGVINGSMAEILAADDVKSMYDPMGAYDDAYEDAFEEAVIHALFDGYDLSSYYVQHWIESEAEEAGEAAFASEVESAMDYWDHHRQNVKIIADSEIHFDPTITLDNGLKFGAHIEFEANNPSGGGNVDEYDLFVSGSFGEVRIGANDGAQDKFSGGIPCPKFSCSDDGLMDRTGVNSIDVDGSHSGDDIKISYFTPSFAGFQAGASYIPSDDDEGARISGNQDSDSYELGARYANTFGDFSVSIGGGYYNSGVGGDRTDNWGASAALGYAGFTLGGSMKSDKDGDDKAWGVGATYATGPWHFGAHYARQTEKGGSDADSWNASVGGAYTLAAGVTLGASVEFGEVDYSISPIDSWLAYYYDDESLISSSDSEKLIAGAVYLGLAF